MTLSRLGRQDFDAYWEIIVVMNQCTDDTEAIVHHQYFPVPINLICEATPGAAAARNAGVAAARGEFIIFLDNDILVEPNFLQAHLNSLSANPLCWIVGRIVGLPDQERTVFGQFRKSLEPSHLDNELVHHTDAFTAANVSMPRSAFEQLGGFDECFHVASSEDLDLAIRARQAGIKILLDRRIVGVHNDWAGCSIRDYCVRQRLYSQSEPLLWRKHGSNHPRLKLVQENSPPHWKEDSPKLLTRKLIKQIVGFQMTESALIAFCNLIEKRLIYRPLLWRVYRLLVSAAIYKGFQEGLTIHSVR